jgi:L-seryl-tRNA(Ser) seleniumtransferase
VNERIPVSAARIRAELAVDRFGNRLAVGLPYAHGELVTSSEDDHIKVRQAWKIIRERRAAGRPVFNFTGLERALRPEPGDTAIADDEIAPALLGEELERVALDHLGGSPRVHATMVFNRLTAAIMASHLALVGRGDTVVGVSATESHPAIIRAAMLVGARFIDTAGVSAFAEALEREPSVRLVAMTRLAVSYEILTTNDLAQIVELAHRKNALVLADDAGGARVGPSVFGQPRMLELGVDLGVTGLDKYGTVGPRLGLLGGRRELVVRVRARGFEYGLEARPMLYPMVLRSLERYDPERVRSLVRTTMELAVALRQALGERVHLTPLTAQLRGEDIVEFCMARAGLSRPPVVPIEATAALAMLLLRDHGINTVHFSGLPPGTSAILFKFVPPETLAEFGGTEALTRSVVSALHELAAIIDRPDALRALLYGGTRPTAERVADAVARGQS